MDSSIKIRYVTWEDVPALMKLSSSVQMEMMKDIIYHQIRFLLKHPFLYALGAVFTILIKFFTQCELRGALVTGALLAFVFETVKFCAFVHRWADIFYLGDDIKTAVQTFSGPKRCLLVAEMAGRVVGCVGVREQNDAMSTVGQLTRMFIAPDCRGQQLGSRLMYVAKGEFRNRKYDCIELLTHHSNEGAIAFYKKLGFTQFNVIHYANMYPLIYDQIEFVLKLE